MSSELTPLKKALLIILILCSIFIAGYALYKYYPLGVDWEYTYSRLNIRDPYTVKGFLNPPFTMIFLPHSFLPDQLGNTINILLNISVVLYAIHKLGGDWKTLGLVFTSPVFFDLCRTNNIEWLPLLGLTIGPNLGGTLLLCKPQSLGLVFLIWAKRNWKILLVPIGVTILSFLIWGFWPNNVGFNPMNMPFNFSILPIGIPYGIYLLWRAWKEDDEYLAAVSTPLFAPYIAPYSFVGVLTVLGCKYKKAAPWFYLGLWAYTIIEYRRKYLSPF
jgi:hypothetical protein